MAQDPYKYFRIEASDIVEQLSKGMLDLERGAPGREHVPRLLRHAHTIKGAARVVKQKDIAEIAHAIEDALSPFRESAESPPREIVDAVLSLVDRIGAKIAELGAPEPSRASEPQPQRPEEPQRTLRTDVGEMDALVDGLAEAHVQLSALRGQGPSLEQLRHLHERLVQQLRSVAKGRGGAVALALADELGGAIRSFDRAFRDSAGQVDRELRSVRETAERLRLVPVSSIFHVLERTARDVARSADKRIVFETRGGDVRLDRDVIALVQNAFVQLVRNAVAHGIEREHERASAGKPRDGKILVEVARRGGRVTLSCADDGAGLDLDGVRRMVVQRGGRAAGELGPEALFAQLLQGGISTSASVTDVSGRGVGLDVVREAVSTLGGEVGVQTERRVGTRIELRIPASRASFDGLFVEAGSRLAVIPLDSVRRTLSVKADDIARTADGDSVLVEGNVVRFVPLARSLRVNAPPAPRRGWSAVVVESDGQLAAIGVDRFVGTASVVSRPLPPLTPALPIVAGAALDADGNPQLILDPDVLVAGARAASPAAQPDTRRRAPILVVDDSLTTRMLEQSILESAGFDVELAASGEEGLAKAKARPYALFLVDVEMPGIDGFEFITRVRADAQLAHIPAILVTSRNAPEDKRRGESVGANAYIVKSEFDQADLLNRIRRLVD